MIPVVEFPVAVVLILAVAGICVSILSILEKHVPAIAAFCSYFGAGCQKTMDFTLLRVPIAWWGLVYYSGYQGKRRRNEVVPGTGYRG